MRLLLQTVATPRPCQRSRRLRSPRQVPKIKMPSGHQKQRLSHTRSSVGWPKSPGHWLSVVPAVGRMAGAVIRGRRLADAGDGPARRIGEAEASSGVADCPPIAVVLPGRLPECGGPGASWRLPAARDMPRAASVMTAWPRPSLTDLTKRDRTWRLSCFQSISLARRASSSRRASRRSCSAVWPTRMRMTMTSSSLMTPS